MTTSDAHSAQSLVDILRKTTLNDHDEILRAAESVLKRSTSDVNAQQTRVVALLNLERYSEALRAFEEAGESLKEKAPLIWGYTLYKNGRLDEARQVASLGSRDRGLRHLEAQVAYRAEDFAMVEEIYKTLPTNGSRDGPGDVNINRLATNAQLNWTGNGHLVNRVKPTADDMEAFMTMFNIACVYIAKGELKQSNLLLKKSMDLCNATDELSESEKRTELIPILVQHIYVLCRLGRLQEAEKLCVSMDIADASDPITQHIAQANILNATVQDSNPYLSYRKFQSTLDFPSNERPFSYQASILKRSALALDLQAKKFDGVVRSTEAQLSKQTLPSINADVAFAGVCNAAAQAKDQTGKAALREIVPLLQRRPNDVGLLLTVIQLYTLTKNDEAAANVLEAFFKRLEASATLSDLDVRYSPGLVAILVSLSSRHGRRDRSRTELARAASHWRQRSKTGQLPAALLISAGSALLEGFPHVDYAAARDCFTAANKQDPQNPIIIAGLIASTTDLSDRFDMDKTPSLASLIAGIDGHELERAGIARPPTSSDAVSPNTRKRTVDPNSTATQAPTPKRIRKSRTPKEFDPSKKADPERWIPLRDRSSYRPKGKKGKARAAGATQGGVVNEESRPSTPGVQMAAPRANKAKKKKGKGGK